MTDWIDMGDFGISLPDDVDSESFFNGLEEVVIDYCNKDAKKDAIIHGHMKWEILEEHNEN